MSGIQIDPAWISTDERMMAFNEVRQRTSFLRMLFLGFRLPADMPAVRTGARWTPIVYFASGELHASPAGLRFRAKDPTTSLLQYRGVNTDLAFDLARDDIQSVEKYEGPPAFIRYYHPPFLRIRTSRSGLLADFLICAGGRGPSMKQIREKTDILRAALR